MNIKHLEIIAQLLVVQKWQIENTVKLLDDKCTIPFISRYRKEATGELDEVQISLIKTEYEKLVELEKRRESILQTIDEQGKLTDELRRLIEATYNANELEDLYLPYKPKKRTRAMIARENGLEPLANIIFEQKTNGLPQIAETYFNENIQSVDEALAGARDIIAENISESTKARDMVRNLFNREAVISSKVTKGKEDEGEKYKDYFAWSEPLAKCPSHRLLALKRGMSEGILKVSISVENENALQVLKKQFINSKTKNWQNEAGEQMELAIKDSYSRLLEPSIETEFSNIAKEKADKEAIDVFASNLRQLLLSAPLGQKRVLAIDPGYRTGCKVVCLDAQGNMLHNETIYPHKPQEKVKEAISKIERLVSVYDTQAIAIGNGTASRETEFFIQKKITFDRKVQVFVVSENGASVYSASPIAREEFPQYDVTVRGAISIGRRLMDPLAELVKIDPKSIGVGQYQHDVNQTMLKSSLDNVVESCVNLVGVDVNTASKHLLTYISGLGPSLAQNIVEYRKENGAFQSRKELLNVKRMGAKGFQQAAGFLRISGGSHPLDNSAVHPEAYYIVEKMATDLNCTISELISNEDLRKKVNLQKYVDKKVGFGGKSVFVCRKYSFYRRCTSWNGTTRNCEQCYQFWSFC